MPHVLSLAPSRAVAALRGFVAMLGPVAGLFAVAASCSPASAADSRVIYMVIQAEPETTMGEVKEKFELARQATTGCNVREVLIEPIDPQTFTILRSILQRGLGAVQEQQPATVELVRPMVGVDSGWSIDLGNPFELIESVLITLPGQPGGKEGGEEAVRVTVPGPNPEGYSLKFHSPGRYVLSLPKGVNPRSLKAEAVSDDGKSDLKRRVVEQEWPSVGRAYLVTLSDVVGDESAL
ncbi:MAG: hypothetical protein FJ275_13670, partial [Planctomycetes bacterium]|nr:hypothetical protein [Planctomycetota bacterium]